VPTDSGPRALDKGDVPFRLLEASDTPVTARPPSAAAVKVEVFFLTGEHLVAKEREVAPVNLRNVLLALLEGPTDEESKQGIRTAVRGRDLLLSAIPDGSVAHVDLDSSFADVVKIDQVEALGQIVFSATGVPGIDSVVFSLDGRPVQSFREDGSLIDRPLQRSDFPLLFPA
jgi:spore germination protein GerM